MLKTRQGGVLLVLVHSLIIERVIRNPLNVLDNSFIMSRQVSVIPLKKGLSIQHVRIIFRKTNIFDMFVFRKVLRTP